MNRPGLNSRIGGREDAARRIRFALQLTFGMQLLRDGREEVVTQVRTVHNTLAAIAAGAGKSRCDLLPEVLLSRRNVVVSPPIALMKDQCALLRQRGSVEQATFARSGDCDNCTRIAALEDELAGRAQQTIHQGSPGVNGVNGAAQAGSSASAAGTPPAARFRPDDLVRIRRYGQAKVIAADPLSVNVEFQAGQCRSFQAGYVQRAELRPGQNPHVCINFHGSLKAPQHWVSHEIFG